jgi:hypothetical protein
MIAKQCYPDTESYLILFAGGSGGNFLASLLHDFLFEEEINTVSEFASAHNPFTTNYIVSNEYQINKDRIYNFVNVTDPTKPVIIYDHMYPRWSELFEVFPKCKVLVITLGPNDYDRLRGNFFFKVVAENREEAVWESYKKEYAPLLDSIAQPIDITPELCKKIFPIGSNFFNRSFWAEEYQHEHSVTKIKFVDLMNNTGVLLDQIAEITNRPCPSTALNTYNQYVDAQQKLAEKYMPWVL